MNWSERVRAPSASFRHDGTTIIIDFFSFSLLSTAIQLVTLSTCILIRINSATRQEPVCTTILPTAAWLSVDSMMLTPMGVLTLALKLLIKVQGSTVFHRRISAENRTFSNSFYIY
jgi:hypothetical protein